LKQKFKLIEGKNNQIIPFPENGRRLPINPFKEIAEKFSDAKGNITDETFHSNLRSKSATQLATTFSIPQDGNGIPKLLSCNNQIQVFQLKEVCFRLVKITKQFVQLQANGDDDNSKLFC
jgi:DEAD/DEAH box helicase domain-containing protein